MGEVVSLSRTRSVIDERHDALFDRVEAGGLNVYVMESPIGPFLAFEPCRTPATPELLADAHAACWELCSAFESDAAVREALTADALSTGSLYRPV